jgi:hypothetical protein
VIDQARQSIARTAAVSAEVAKATGEWQARLARADDLEAFNEIVPEVGKLAGPAKAQVWNLVQQHASTRKWQFDPKAKRFVAA